MSENNLEVIIVDDEDNARERLKEILLDPKNGFNVSTVFEASNGFEALEIISKEKPDLAFLDINMPKMDGLELAAHITKLRNQPWVVFTTAYDEHALSAFNLNAIDYVLKPVRTERLKEAFFKIESLVSYSNQKIKQLNTKRNYITVIERGKVQMIDLKEVLYLLSEHKYTTIKTKAKEYLSEETLIELEREFDDEFVRVHRNALVPVNKIISFEKMKVSNVKESLNFQSNNSSAVDEEADGKSWFVTIDGVDEKVAVSRRQWSILRKRFSDLKTK